MCGCFLAVASASPLTRFFAAPAFPSMVRVAGRASRAVCRVVGASRRSDLVIALPVITAVGVGAALAFWGGWTMSNTEADLAELEQSTAVPAMV